MSVSNEEPKLALFIDFENIALGVRDASLKKFEIGKVLARLVEKGKIIVKKAYADWTSYKDYKRTFHAAGIELIDIPQRGHAGKNSADIKMVVDAMELSYSKEHIGYFVILSGDSDFFPLVSKLKENDKNVIGVGLRSSTSDLLASNCDEFIFYDDLVAQQGQPKAMTRRISRLPKSKQKLFSLITEAIDALAREDKDVIWSSMVKQTIKRKEPAFSEAAFGYRSFSEVMMEGAELGLFEITRDAKGGAFRVTNPQG